MHYKRIILIATALLIISSCALAQPNCQVQSTSSGYSAIFCNGQKITQDAGEISSFNCLNQGGGVYTCQTQWHDEIPSGPGGYLTKIFNFVVLGDYAVWGYRDIGSIAYFTNNIQSPYPSGPKRLTHETGELYGIRRIIYNQQSVPGSMESLSGLGVAKPTQGVLATIAYPYIIEDRFVYASSDGTGVAFYVNSISDPDSIPKLLTQKVGLVYGPGWIVKGQHSVMAEASDVGGLGNIPLGQPAKMGFVYIIEDYLIYAAEDGSGAAYYINSITDPGIPEDLMPKVGSLYDIDKIIYGSHTESLPGTVSKSYIVEDNLVFIGSAPGGMAFYKSSFLCPGLAPERATEIVTNIGNEMPSFLLGNASCGTGIPGFSAGNPFQYKYCTAPGPGTTQTFDPVRSCTVCGNNLVDGTDVCDGTDLAGETCQTMGFVSGTLSCLADCSGFDTSACFSPSCPNGVIDSGEDCEQGLPITATCIGLGFDGGTLGCQPNCSFDTSACTTACVPETCASLGKDCGSWSDGCGDTLNCGVCEPVEGIASITSLTATTPIEAGLQSQIHVEVSEPRDLTVQLFPLASDSEIVFSAPTGAATSFDFSVPVLEKGQYRLVVSIEEPCEVCVESVVFTVMAGQQGIDVPETSPLLVVLVALSVLLVVRLRK